MVELTAKLKVRRGTYRIDVRGQLALPFEQRQKSRQRVRLVSGEEVAMKLPRGEILRGGDLVNASDGRVIEIVAVPEKLLHIEAGDLARVAYHLGNRHVPVQIGDGFLRIAEDHVLEELASKLGAHVSHVEAPFEPEGGAYHQHEEMGHGGKIHDHFADHDHAGGHDHAHAHVHKHEHR